MHRNHLVLYSALLFQEGVQLFLHDFLKEKDRGNLAWLQLSSGPAAYIQAKRTQPARCRRFQELRQQLNPS